MIANNVPEKCHVFICYRQQDGLAAADWLYKHLHGRTIQLERSSETLQLDVYLDRDAPAVDNWQEIWLPKLQVARALLFVCTPSAAKRRDGTDWVYRELDKWITLRQSGPIVIDATGEADKYLPRIIQERWPNAQRIVCQPEAWEKLPASESQQQAERVISRILRGIRISEEGYWLEELERLKTLNRKLFRRLVATVVLFGVAVVLAVLSRIYQLQAEREEIIATAGQLSARSAFLRQQDGPALEKSVLLAVEALDLASQVEAPSLPAWRALNEGIKLLPGKMGPPLHPFGSDAPVSTYVSNAAVLFVRRGTVPVGDNHSALWSFERESGVWKLIRHFNRAEHGEFATASKDGRWMVTRRSGNFTVWNTAEGVVVREIAGTFVEAPQSTMAISEGGRWLAVGTGYKLQLYDLHADATTPGRSLALDRPSRGIFSPDEKHLAYADEERLILYSLASGEILHQAQMPLGTDQIVPPMFSADGEYLAVGLASHQTVQMAPSATPGGVNHRVSIWRVPVKPASPAATASADWLPLETIVRENRFNVVFSQARETPRLAILERSQPVQVLDLFSKASFTLSAGEQGARSAAFAHGELLSVNWDGTARLWDTKHRVELKRLTQSRPVVAAHFLHARGWGGARFLTVSDNGEARLWGRPQQSMVVARGSRHLLTWSASGDYFLSPEGLAYRTDAQTGERVEVPLSVEPYHSSVAAALSPDGRYAAFATKWAPPGQPQTLRLVDIEGEREQINLPLENRVEVQELAVASGGSPVLARARGGAVFVWTPGAKAGEDRLRIFPGSEVASSSRQNTSAVLLDPAGSSFLRIVPGSNTTLVQRAPSGKILGDLQLPARWRQGRVRPTWRMSKSGEYLAFPADDGQFFLVQTGSLLASRIVPQQPARLLQVDNTGRLLFRSQDAFFVVDHAGMILYRLADASIPDTGQLSPDGRLLLVVESDGEVTVWDLEKGIALASLSANGEITGALFGSVADVLILEDSRSFSMRLWKSEDMVSVATSLIGRDLSTAERQAEVGYIRTR